MLSMFHSFTLESLSQLLISVKPTTRSQRHWARLQSVQMRFENIATGRSHCKR